jgi:hypothetical protein
LETVFEIVLEINKSIAQDAIASLPEELLHQLKEWVTIAPRTDEEWENLEFRSIGGGTYWIPPGKTQADVLASIQESRKQRDKELQPKYRNGIEVLRTVFGTEQ